jgi:hypothetical protein
VKTSLTADLSKLALAIANLKRRRVLAAYIRDDQGAESSSAQRGAGRRVSKGARRTMLKIATG